MSGPSSAPARRSWIRRVLALGFWTFAAILLVGFLGFLGFVYSLDRFEQKPETRADGIVALTGGAQRIGEAIDLLAQGYAKRLLISGVNEKTSREQISSLNPGQRRLFDCCVDLDYRARNTIGNAIETRRWAEQNGFDAIIVVTSNYHMPRTLVELDHALPNLQKIPYPVAATIDPHRWWRHPSTARVIFTEYLKFLAVWVRTRFEKDPERSSVAHLISGGAPSRQVIAEPLWRQSLERESALGLRLHEVLNGASGLARASPIPEDWSGSDFRCNGKPPCNACREARRFAFLTWKPC